jgi:hypothetical protein
LSALFGKKLRKKIFIVVTISEENSMKPFMLSIPIKWLQMAELLHTSYVKVKGDIQNVSSGATSASSPSRK